MAGIIPEFDSDEDEFYGPITAREIELDWRRLMRNRKSETPDDGIKKDPCAMETTEKESARFVGTSDVKDPDLSDMHELKTIVENDYIRATSVCNIDIQRLNQSHNLEKVNDMTLTENRIVREEIKDFTTVETVSFDTTQSDIAHEMEEPPTDRINESITQETTDINNSSNHKICAFGTSSQLSITQGMVQTESNNESTAHEMVHIKNINISGSVPCSTNNKIYDSGDLMSAPIQEMGVPQFQSNNESIAQEIFEIKNINVSGIDLGSSACDLGQISQSGIVQVVEAPRTERNDESITPDTVDIKNISMSCMEPDSANLGPISQAGIAQGMEAPRTERNDASTAPETTDIKNISMSCMEPDSANLGQISQAGIAQGMEAPRTERNDESTAPETTDIKNISMSCMEPDSANLGQISQAGIAQGMEAPRTERNDESTAPETTDIKNISMSCMEPDSSNLGQISQAGIAQGMESQQTVRNDESITQVTLDIKNISMSCMDPDSSNFGQMSQPDITQGMKESQTESSNESITQGTIHFKNINLSGTGPGSSSITIYDFGEFLTSVTTQEMEVSEIVNNTLYQGSQPDAIPRVNESASAELSEMTTEMDTNYLSGADLTLSNSKTDNFDKSFKTGTTQGLVEEPQTVRKNESIAEETKNASFQESEINVIPWIDESLTEEYSEIDTEMINVQKMDETEVRQSLNAQNIEERKLNESSVMDALIDQSESVILNERSTQEDSKIPSKYLNQSQEILGILLSNSEYIFESLPSQDTLKSVTLSQDSENINPQNSECGIKEFQSDINSSRNSINVLELNSQPDLFNSSKSGKLSLSFENYKNMLSSDNESSFVSTVDDIDIEPHLVSNNKSTIMSLKEQDSGVFLGPEVEQAGSLAGRVSPAAMETDDHSYACPVKENSVASAVGLDSNVSSTNELMDQSISIQDIKEETQDMDHCQGKVLIKEDKVIVENRSETDSSERSFVSLPTEDETDFQSKKPDGSYVPPGKRQCIQRTPCKNKENEEPRSRIPLPGVSRLPVLKPATLKVDNTNGGTKWGSILSKKKVPLPRKPDYIVSPSKLDRLLKCTPVTTKLPFVRPHTADRVLTKKTAVGSLHSNSQVQVTPKLTSKSQSTSKLTSYTPNKFNSIPVLVKNRLETDAQLKTPPKNLKYKDIASPVAEYIKNPSIIIRNVTPSSGKLPLSTKNTNSHKPGTIQSPVLPKLGERQAAVYVTPKPQVLKHIGRVPFSQEKRPGVEERPSPGRIPRQTSVSNTSFADLPHQPFKDIDVSIVEKQ